MRVRYTQRMLRYSALLLATTLVASAQTIQVTKENKTITVTAEQTLSFAPDGVKMTIGRRDYAPSNEEAYRATKTAMARVVDAIHQAGVTDDRISSTGLSVSQTEPDNETPKELREKRRFRSYQTVTLLLPVKPAQEIVDACIRAGANDLDGAPEWLLLDESEAQAKAAGAALKKARINAEQMASGLGAKLGDLVYASNTVPNTLRYLFALGSAMNTVSASVSSTRKVPDTEPKLSLFPKPVEVKATVYATFAIQ